MKEDLAWVREYNNEYPHQGLNYKGPRQCYEESIKMAAEEEANSL